MTDLDYRPIPHWTDPETKERQFARFKRAGSSYSRVPIPLSETEQLLEREARSIGAPRVVIQVVAKERAFRLDGLMRADAKVEHPGVVVSMDTKHGPLRYATDLFPRWQDNLRAIALALEALRKVDRYGVTKRGEQYTGWKALPPGGTPMPAAMTVEDAAQVLAVLADPHGLMPRLADALSRGDLIDATYRSAAKLHHPDRGGDPKMWAKIDEAKRVLDQHGSRS